MSAPGPADSDVDRVLWSLRAYDTVALATAGESAPHVAAYFFAPERDRDGIRLLIAMPRDSRKLREIESDERVGFMCYPGSAARWITGRGAARPLLGETAALELSARLLAHAPDAHAFIEGSDVVGIELHVEHIEVVDALDTPPRVLDF
ncbi:MAG TPA: pyridoxamine 5'-phosphate oxidase family protein [Candidatus Dormibacteraeota bacterium]|nr:pyridoxamine 5'-phosphate oxidase family protein [Candidatus Dormibacteraeota bacterium]